MSSFPIRRYSLRLAAPLFALALAAGCATPPPADDAEAMADFVQVNDPFEPLNRDIFEFNQAVDRALLKPVAKGYREYVPQYGRERVRDFLQNLRSPLVFANDVLQGDPDRAMQTLMRFAFNTGFGIGGLFDVAQEGGINPHEEDFGQTLAVWGVGEGPYIVLPIMGPSNPRDTTGLVVEWVVDPVNYRLDHAGYEWAVWTRAGMTGIEKREKYLDVLDEVERQSIDYYAAVRSLYRQRRAAEVTNGKDIDKIPDTGLSSVGTSAIGLR